MCRQCRPSMESCRQWSDCRPGQSWSSLSLSLSYDITVTTRGLSPAALSVLHGASCCCLCCATQSTCWSSGGQAGGGRGEQDADLQLLLGRERGERERKEMWYFVTLGLQQGN